MVPTEVPASQRMLLDVVRLSTQHLAQNGSQSPRLDAELLAAHALGLRRIDLYLQHERPLSESELAAVRELVRRRAHGEPVAYLTGLRDFYGRGFMVDPAVLVPRPETETLVSVALDDLRSRGEASRVVDLGTGSGCIAVTIALECPDAAVVAVDSSEAALAVARRNAAALGADSVEFVHGEWAAPVVHRVDLVVSNPPYVTSAELADLMRDVRDHEPASALDGGADGLETYRALLQTLQGKLAPGASLCFEVDPRRVAEVAQLIQQRFSATTAMHRDLAGNDRVVVARLAE